MHAEQPAKQHEVSERCRGAEPANFQKTARLFQHSLAAAGDMQRQIDERCTHYDNQQPGT
ncbi:hypothetical protein D3C87_1941990 [compost metagenome]